MRKVMENSQDAETAFEYLKKMQSHLSLKMENMFLTSPFFYVGHWPDGWSYGGKSLLVYYSEKENDNKEIEFIDYYPKQISEQKVLLTKNGIQKEISLKRVFKKKILPVSFNKGLNWIYFEAEEVFVPKDLGVNDDMRELGVCYFLVSKDEPYFESRAKRIESLNQISSQIDGLLGSLKNNPKDLSALNQIKALLEKTEPGKAREIISEMERIKDFSFDGLFQNQEFITVNRDQEGWVEGKESMVVFYAKEIKTKKMKIFSDRMPGNMVPFSLTITIEDTKKTVKIDSYEPYNFEIKLKKGISFLEIDSEKSFFRNSDKKELGFNYQVE